MADAAYEDLFDWLQEHEGEQVAMEVGTRDPDSDDPGDAIVLVQHVTLGAVQPASDEGVDRLVTMVRLASGERDRLYFDKARVTRVQKHLGVVKVTFHDRFYISLVGAGLD